MILWVKIVGTQNHFYLIHFRVALYKINKYLELSSTLGILNYCLDIVKQPTECGIGC